MRKKFNYYFYPSKTEKNPHNIQFKNKTKSVLDVQVLQTKACILDLLFCKRTIHYIVKYKT